MKCKYCGHALASDSAICPNCGMLMTDDQLKMRKSYNGYNNPYIKRLNDINKNREYSNNNNVETSSIGAALLIVLILIIVTIIAVIIFINNR
jgi:uncharacterized membrane protein YvbJ